MKELKDAVSLISTNITDVNNIVDENRRAVNTIVDMNENTTLIAETLQSQSSDNKKMAKQMDALLDKFQQ